MGPDFNAVTAECRRRFVPSVPHFKTCDCRGSLPASCFLQSRVLIIRPPIVNCLTCVYLLGGGGVGGLVLGVEESMCWWGDLQKKGDGMSKTWIEGRREWGGGEINI